MQERLKFKGGNYMGQQHVLEKQQWDLWFESRDSKAAEQLVKMYMPLVDYHVQRISSGLPSNVSYEELKSLGLVGLFDALSKFDPGRDLKFNTYASFRVKGAILDGLRKKDWLPRSVREKSKRIENTKAKLEQKYLRHISMTEIADELNMSEAEVLKTIQENALANLIFIDEKYDENNNELSLQIEDTTSLNPEQQMMKNELIRELSEAIVNLNKNEQLVINLFYEQGLTFTEIGKVLNLSTSRISQIHSKAIHKLRHILDKDA